MQAVNICSFHTFFSFLLPLCVPLHTMTVHDVVYTSLWWWTASLCEAAAIVYLTSPCSQMYMKSQSTRQGKSKQLCPKTTPSFSQDTKKRDASGGIPTHNVLRTRQTQAEFLKVMQCKGCLSPDKQGNSISVLWSAAVGITVNIIIQIFVACDIF